MLNNIDSLSIRVNQGDLHPWKHSSMNISTYPIITMVTGTRMAVAITMRIRITIRITIVVTITISIVSVRAEISLPIHQNVDSASIVINENNLPMEQWSLFHHSIIPAFIHSIISSFHHSIIPSFRE
jgi:branched-subunit amino acid permease